MQLPEPHLQLPIQLPARHVTAARIGGQAAQPHAGGQAPGQGGLTHRTPVAMRLEQGGPVRWRPCGPVAEALCAPRSGSLRRRPGGPVGEALRPAR